MSIFIEKFKMEQERDWLHCRVLSFLNTAYFDDVIKLKPRYKNSAIELVALEEGKVVGILDIELEAIPKEICSNNIHSGMIHHIAVHPDHQRKQIGNLLLKHAENIALSKGIPRLEAWTRDDPWVRSWYIQNGFKEFYSYLHVYLDGNDITLKSEDKNIKMVNGFAHYTGEDKEIMKSRFKRTHECIGFEKFL